MTLAHVRDAVVEKDGQLHLDGLPIRAGDRVEVVVIRREHNGDMSARYPLHGTPIRYQAPFDPATNPAEWEANG